MKKGRWWLIGLVTALLIIIGIGGKQYMDKKAIEKDYQQGIDLIQKYVSNYLVEILQCIRGWNTQLENY
ncbi:MAG: hypothetical protein ACYCEI_07445 [Enterococcus faecalis]